uniref:Uncharacterized protein n=1 Tax=Anguilla anguilla TaxID=7936 RepID=A0A0E9T504_ANGAN
MKLRILSILIFLFTLSTIYPSKSFLEVFRYPLQHTLIQRTATDL